MNNRPKLFRMTTHSKTLGLIKGQIGFINRDFDVLLVAKDTGNLEQLAKEEGVNFKDIEIKREISPLSDIKSLWCLYRFFRKEKPDIIHANTPKGALLSMLAAKFAGVKHRIYNVNGLRFETASGKLRKLLIMMEKIACACATKVIPQSNGVKRVLIEERITRKPLEIIRYGSGNGVDIDFFNPNLETIKEKAVSLNHKENLHNKFVFIFIGRIVKDKGVNELIVAFDRLSKEYDNINLRLLGNYENDLDPIEENTQQIILNNPNIIYEGFQKDIRPFLAASNVLILPSYREGFPNVVLQACAMGLPCIVTNVNGAEDVIINDFNGIVISKKNTEALYLAMKDMIANKAKIEKLSSNTRSFIEKRFKNTDVWEATLEMYKSL